MKIKIKNSRYYYDDTKLIGSGSFSNVYECYDGKYKYLNYTCILTRTMLLYICIHVVPEEKHDLSLVAPVNGVSP